MKVCKDVVSRYIYPGILRGIIPGYIPEYNLGASYPCIYPSKVGVSFPGIHTNQYNLGVSYPGIYPITM